MHQCKTVAKVILILSFVNIVLAAPAVREIHEAPDDVIVRVLAEDMGAVVEKRYNLFGTPMAPWEDSDWGSGSSDGYETAPDEPSRHITHQTSSTSEIQPWTPEPGDTSDRSSTSRDPPTTSTETPPPSSSTSSLRRPRPRPPKPPKIMTPEKIKATKIIAGVGLVTAAVLSLVDIDMVFKDQDRSTN